MNVAAAVSAGTLHRRLAAKLAEAFAHQGRDGTAALDARLLLAHAMGVDAADLALHDDQLIGAEAQAAALALVEGRIAGVPVARLVGRSAFFGNEFDIGPDTLVPRSDSEIVVDAALAFTERRNVQDRPLAVVDLGTGSGILILSLLSEVQQADGVGVDLVPGALAVARRNAERLGLGERTKFVLGNWGMALAGDFDIVLANPPYIPSRAIVGLQVEVSVHDPHIALDGGPDGLTCYREIFADLDRILAKFGRAFFEIGFGQAGDVADLAERYGFSAIFHRDLCGIERVGEVRRRNEDLCAGGTG